MVVGARRIRSEVEGTSVHPLEGEGVEWDGDNNVKHMWEQMNG